MKRTPATRRACRCGGGFSLIQYLVVITLLSTFSLLLSAVFMASMKTLRESQQTRTTVMHLDLAVRQLRADVWGSRSIEVVSPTEVRLVQGDGREVRWVMTKGQEYSVTVEEVVPPPPPPPPPPAPWVPVEPQAHPRTMDEIWGDQRVEDDSPPRSAVPTAPAPAATEPAAEPVPEEPPPPPEEPTYRTVTRTRRQPDGYLRIEIRDGKAVSERPWDTSVNGITFAGEGPLLIVHVPGRLDDRWTELRLVSQLQLAEVRR